jgi:hypothetical protein
MASTEKEIKNHYFKNHKAKYNNLNEEMFILDWEDPTSKEYNIRYVMDGKFLYVTGGLNAATYRFDWRNLKLSSFLTIEIDYFYKNLISYQESNIIFNPQKAQYEIEEKTLEEKEFPEETNKKLVELLEQIYNLTKECVSHKEWKRLLSSSDIVDDLVKFTPDFYVTDIHEWIFTIGDDIPNNIKAHLIGLKMAAKQLDIELVKK